MKRTFIFTLIFLFMLFSSLLYSQDSTKTKKDSVVEEEEVPENMKYFKQKYEEVYSESFDLVWSAIKASFEQCNCMIGTDTYKQGDDGFYSGTLRSDMCIFVSGEDSTPVKLKEYSTAIPLIHGARWTNGRCIYTFKVKEFNDGTVHVTLKTKVCGWEEQITHAVHFWDETRKEMSNGTLEFKMLELVMANIQALKKK
jgi:hypothetical protein